MRHNIQLRIGNVDWRSVAIEAISAVMLILVGMLIMLMLLDNFPEVVGYTIEPYLEDGHVPV